MKRLAGFAAFVIVTAYCVGVVWAVGQLDAAGFNFRGEW